MREERRSGTPVGDFIRAYRDREPLRLHMPGHKGRGAVEALDITEIQGADPLYSGRGVLRESEERAAALFGAGRTVFSAEGSSLCVRAMLLLARMRAEREGRRPLILAGRNAHHSFLTGAALLGAEVRWLRGESLLTCRPTAAGLAAELARMRTKPCAVWLTSPDYLGNRADIRALAEVCHARDVPLMVDNAHGAYLRFLPEDQHPLSLGADLTCDSAHKTLGALTGGAYLHIHREADPFFAEQADRAMRVFASTSPSWLILESLDRCNASLENGYRERLAAFLREVSGLKVRLREAGYELAGDEPLKVTLAPKSRGYTGDGLHALLRERNIECEFSDPDYLVMMVTPETETTGLERLACAFQRIPRREAIREAPPPSPAPSPAMSVREAMLAPAEEVPAERSEGRILADANVQCPPAVPIAVCGERIGKDAVRCFAYYGISRVFCVAGPSAAAQHLRDA